jgi:hypothetical protein
LCVYIHYIYKYAYAYNIYIYLIGAVCLVVETEEDFVEKLCERAEFW